MSASVESAIVESSSFKLCHYELSDKYKSSDKTLDKVETSDKEPSPCESCSPESSDKIESSDRNDTLDKGNSSDKHESSDMLLHRTELIDKAQNKTVPLDKAPSPDKDKSSGLKSSDKDSDNDESSTKTESLDKVGSLGNNGIIKSAEASSDDKLVDFKFCETKQSDEAVTSINSSLISSCGDISIELLHPVTNNNITSSFSSSLSLTSSSSTVVLSSSSPSSSSSCPSITSSTDCSRVKSSISTNHGEGASGSGTPFGETADNELKLEVTCGPNSACLHMSRLQLGSKGTCVLFDNAWLTPNEFQYVSGRETAKDWKRSIKHHGKSLKVLIAKGILSTAPPHCACSQCAQGSKGLEKEGGKGGKVSSVTGGDCQINMKETSCASKTLLPSALSASSSSSSSSSASISLSSCGPCTDMDLTRGAGQPFSNRGCNTSGAVVVSSHKQNSPIVSPLRSNTSPVNLSNTAAHTCFIEHRKDDANNNNNNESNSLCCSDSNISNHGKVSVEWSSERLSDGEKIERKRKHSDSSEGRNVDKKICTAKDRSTDQRSPDSNRGESVREEMSEEDLKRERFLNFLSSRPFLTNPPLFSKAAESVIPQLNGFSNGSLTWPSAGPPPDMKYPIVPLLDIKYPTGPPLDIKYPSVPPPDMKYPSDTPSEIKYHTGPPSDIKVPQYPSLAPPCDSSDYWMWWRRMAEGMLTPPGYTYPPQIKPTPDPWSMYLHNLLPNKNAYPELPPAPWTHCSPIPPQLLNLSHYPQDPLQFRLYPTPTPVAFNPSPYIPPEILAEFYNRTALSNPFTPRFCL